MSEVCNILLADDNPLDVRLTREAFANLDMPTEVHCVGDGDEALAYLRRQGPHRNAPMPDLVVLDLMMPKKGGLQVLQEIRADAVLRRVLVVILTTSDARGDVTQAGASAADAFCTKPLGRAGMRLVALQLEGLVRDRRLRDKKTAAS